MNKEPRFFLCTICGNLVGKIYDKAGIMVCCGKDMVELKPNTVEASTEKHLPVVSVDSNKVVVKVGAVAHPMLPEHFIGWVYLQTEKGGQRQNLSAGMQPEVSFLVNSDDKPIAAYAYCNLHGLWKTTI
jgi:superoxide reductase